MERAHEQVVNRDKDRVRTGGLDGGKHSCPDLNDRLKGT